MSRKLLKEGGKYVPIQDDIIANTTAIYRLFQLLRRYTPISSLSKGEKNERLFTESENLFSDRCLFVAGSDAHQFR